MAVLYPCEPEYWKGFTNVYIRAILGWAFLTVYDIIYGSLVQLQLFCLFFDAVVSVELHQFNLDVNTRNFAAILSEIVDCHFIINFYHHFIYRLLYYSCSRMVKCNTLPVLHAIISYQCIDVRPWARKLGQLWYEIFSVSCNLSPEERAKLISEGYNDPQGKDDQKNAKQFIIAMHPHGIVPLHAVIWASYCDQYLQEDGKCMQYSSFSYFLVCEGNYCFS